MMRVCTVAFWLVPSFALAQPDYSTYVSQRWQDFQMPQQTAAWTGDDDSRGRLLHAELFVFVVAAELYAKDQRVGLLHKAVGYRHRDRATDILAFCAVPSSGDGCAGEVVLVDILVALGTATASPSWQVLGALPRDESHRWRQPFGASLPPEPGPPGAVTCAQLATALEALRGEVVALAADLRVQLGRIETHSQAASVEALAAAMRASELLARKPPVYKGSLLGFGLTLKPQ